MTLYAAKSSRGKPIWIADWTFLRKQRKKSFPRNPNLKPDEDPGYRAAREFYDEISMKYGPESVLAAMSHAERSLMVQVWQTLKESGVKPPDCAAFVMERIPGVLLLREAVDLLLRELKILGRSIKYQRNMKSILGQFCEAFPGYRINEVTSNDIQRWRDAGPYRPITRRSRLTDVKTFFNFATVLKWVRENPTIGIKSPTVIREKPGILSVNQANELMMGAYHHDRELCGWLALALFEGVRICELERISRAQLVQDGRYLDLEWKHVKGGGKTRRLLLHDNTREWTALEGEIPPRNLKRLFKRLRKRLGLFEKWPHNAMRHSAASYMFAYTDDAGKTTKHLGQTESVFHNNYHYPVSKEEAERFYAIRPPSGATIGQ